MAVRAAVRHFESAAAGYGRFRDAWPLGALRRQERQALHELARVQPGERVLDVGCGDGTVLSWLVGRGARPIGVDVAFAMARQCHRRGLPVCVQDMEHLGVRPVFDWVLCVGSLEFVADPARALAALGASVRPGGRLVLLFPRRGWATRLYAAYHRAHGVPIHVFTRSEMADLICAVGLRLPIEWRDCALSSLCVAEKP